MFSACFAEHPILVAAEGRAVTFAVDRSTRENPANSAISAAGGAQKAGPLMFAANPRKEDSSGSIYGVVAGKPEGRQAAVRHSDRIWVIQL